MMLGPDGTILLDDDAVLGAQWSPGDGRAGTLRLQLASAMPRVVEGVFALDPWDPDGFRIEDWIEGLGLVVCGAQRILVLNRETLDLGASIALEYEECEVAPLPWLLKGPDSILLTTESRIFCIDPRLAVRWCWTVRVFTSEWFKVCSAPNVSTGVVEVSLSSHARDETVQLSLADGTEI